MTSSSSGLMIGSVLEPRLSPQFRTVTRHSPCRPPVSACLFLFRLCCPGCLVSAVPRLSLPLLPPRASSASASSVVIVLVPLQALLYSSSKLCYLSPVACSATAPSWKTIPDSVSDFLLLLCGVEGEKEKKILFALSY
ncbi:hypothetical protein S245_020834 [Arachis hypogaea]